mgnify:CR=1 FL=1
MLRQYEDTMATVVRLAEEQTIEQGKAPADTWGPQAAHMQDMVLQYRKLREEQKRVEAESRTATKKLADAMSAKEFVLPAEAVATRVDFGSQAAATAFREALLNGSDVETAAAEQGGTVAELGLLKPGQTEPEIDAALFAADAFEALPGGALQVSDILVLQTEVAAEPAADAEAADDAAGDGAVSEAPTTREAFVVLVAERIPERVRPLEDVRAQVEAAVLAQKRQAARSAWLAEQRAAADIVEYGASGAAFEVPATETVTEPGTDAAASEDAADETPAEGEAQ